MLASFTARQFFEWQAHAETDPFEERRQDYRIASIVSMLANINRDSKKHPKPYVIEDFLLKFGEQEGPKQQTWQDQKSIMMMWAQVLNAGAVES